MPVAGKKALINTFGEEAGVAVHDLIHGRIEPESFYSVEPTDPMAERFPRTIQTYSYCPWSDEAILHAIDELLGTHGVEICRPSKEEHQKHTFHYANTGDTYGATVMLSGSSWLIGTWGDRVEMLERRGVRFD